MTKQKEESTKGPQVFQINCPCCHTLLWIDSGTSEVIKFEKAKKKKGSLDELLIKEKKRKGEFDRKFEATAELQKERWKKTKEKFEKALTKLDENE